MKVIEGDGGSAGLPARYMNPLEQFASQVSVWATTLRRKLPYLVWHDDEIDLTITFKNEKLDPDSPFASLFTGSPADAAMALRSMGIEFDSGCGPNGYDWEFDWSLKGPISCRFRGRATKPERRNSPPRPILAVDNTA